MGPEASPRPSFIIRPIHFPGQSEELKDDTHFNSYGALELAKCVVEAIRTLRLPIAKDILPSVATFDPAHPDPPSVWDLPNDPFLSAQKPYER
jgi:hypothetical protein